MTTSTATITLGIVNVPGIDDTLVEYLSGLGVSVVWAESFRTAANLVKRAVEDGSVDAVVVGDQKAVGVRAWAESLSSKTKLAAISASGGAFDGSSSLEPISAPISLWSVIEHMGLTPPEGVSPQFGAGGDLESVTGEGSGGPDEVTDTQSYNRSVTYDATDSAVPYQVEHSESTTNAHNIREGSYADTSAWGDAHTGGGREEVRNSTATRATPDHDIWGDTDPQSAVPDETIAPPPSLAPLAEESDASPVGRSDEHERALHGPATDQHLVPEAAGQMGDSRIPHFPNTSPPEAFTMGTTPGSSHAQSQPIAGPGGPAPQSSEPAHPAGAWASPHYQQQQWPVPQWAAPQQQQQWPGLGQFMPQAGPPQHGSAPYSPVGTPPPQGGPAFGGHNGPGFGSPTQGPPAFNGPAQVGPGFAGPAQGGPELSAQTGPHFAGPGGPGGPGGPPAFGSTTPWQNQHQSPAPADPEPHTDDQYDFDQLRFGPDQSMGKSRGLAPTIVCWAGKGGVGKTSASITIAQVAARAGLKTTLIDTSVGQNGVGIVLRVSKRGVPSVYDAAVSGDMKQAFLTPDMLREIRSGATVEELEFALVSAPPSSLADTTIITGSVYSHIIQLARETSDLVVIDTQIREAALASQETIFTRAVLPILRADGWGAGLTDNGSEGFKLLIDRLTELRRLGVGRERMLTAINKFDPSQVDPSEAKKAFSRHSEFLGVIDQDPYVQAAFNAGRTAADIPGFRLMVNAILSRVTGDEERFPYIGNVEALMDKAHTGTHRGSASSTPKKKRLLGLFGRK